MYAKACTGQWHNGPKANVLALKLFSLRRENLMLRLVSADTD